ncbi:MAG: flagellar hook protein FlgE [Bacteroidota bacterium]
MIRSLNTGISGLRSHQTRMDVVSNNIANINTIAFKRSRVAFGEVLGQQLLGVGRSAGGTGINPSFVGQGVAVGSIDQNWGQGALETTNVLTDLALNGSGFFVARGIDRNVLTRAGNFTFNNDGELVTANSGLKVQAFAYTSDGEVDTSQLSDIQLNFNAQAPPKFTEGIDIGGNLSADAAVGDEVSFSKVIYDEQGTAHAVVVRFTKAADNAWDYTIQNEDTVFADASGQVTFNTDGTLNSPTNLSVNWDTNFVTGGDAITIDFQELTQYASSSTANIRGQDGFASGKFASFTINPEGIILMNYTNGQQEAVYQLALADVDNPNGLEQLGENFYGTSGSSGDSVVGRAGRELSTTVVAGALEMSNVDLAAEFTNMIITQRGYQASARVITTSDEILQETVQLKR